MQRATDALAPAVAQGLRAYAAIARATLSPREASLTLHETLCGELLAARRAYAEGRLDQMCRRQTRCMQVLLALQTDILGAGDGGAGDGAGSAMLAGFYGHLYERVRRAGRRNDVAAEFERIAELLARFCRKMRAAL
ncbi:hypothetical protein ACO2Q3_10910 [Caulobacter sp. KR2-114]|uniref:hypothetical protein n=1 Tax=Caulobacter sp. KR2-114 TaxID=3400912 RepID=UPI003C02A204